MLEWNIVVNVDILNSASRILQRWSSYVKIDSARHQHDTEITQNRAAIDSCFALFGARQYGVTTRDLSLSFQVPFTHMFGIF